MENFKQAIRRPGVTAFGRAQRQDRAVSSTGNTWTSTANKSDDRYWGCKEEEGRFCFRSGAKKGTTMGAAWDDGPR